MKYDGLVIVHHVDKNGKEIAKQETTTDTIGKTYQTNPQNIPGYRLVETPQNARGTYTDGKTDVTYVYVKQSDLVVKHVDQSGQELKPSNTTTSDVASDYQTTAQDISGYVLVTQPENATGKYVDGTTTVTYIYAKQAELVTKYVDESGNTLSPATTETGAVDEDYHTTAKDIPGYVLVEQPKNADGKYVDGKNEVTYVYVPVVPVPEQPLKPESENKNEIDVTGKTELSDLVVKYVDTFGIELHVSKKESGVIDTAYHTAAENIPGYSLIAQPTNADGVYVAGTTEVTYVYVKQADLIVKHVDQAGKELRPTSTNTGDVGGDYQTTAQDIPGYKLVETPTNAVGQYVDGKNEVTYVYVKQADLIVKHVDQAGKELRPTSTNTGNVGGDYQTTAQDIPGYKLVETPTNAIGKYTDGTTTVTYVYMPVTPAPAETTQPVPGQPLTPESGQGETSTPDKTPQETQTKSNQAPAQPHAVTSAAELPQTGEAKGKFDVAMLSAIAGLFLVTFYKRFKKQK